MRDVYKDHELEVAAEKVETPEYLFQFKRTEKKYILDSTTAEILKSQIRYYVPRDEKAMLSPHISSVYYDNAAWKCYREHITRVNPRFKVRIREYDNYDKYFARAFLEIKKKENSVSLKERIRIIPSVGENGAGYISSPGTPSGLLINAESRNNVYYRITDAIKNYKLEPVTKVDYSREAFESEDGTLRITFDSDLVFHAIQNNHTAPVTGEYAMDENVKIMEIKFSGRMPQWLKQMLKSNKLSNARFSKYCASVKNLYDSDRMIPALQKIFSIKNKTVKEYGFTKEYIVSNNAF
jgi:SPX domain protein involved in polyphosphate accumulation